MGFKDYILTVTLIIFSAATFITADSIQGCGGFVEASPALIKSRKPTDSKLDYSHITVELRTLDGLVKDQTQCAPNGYYFIPVYDKGSFVITVRGPEGWSWAPEKVPVIVDHNGCNGNGDINFQFTGFSVSGRIVGAVGGESCTDKNGGPSNVKVELLSLTGDIVSSVLTTSRGRYSFTNIIPGRYRLRASHLDLQIEAKGSAEVELGFENVLVDDIFVVPGYTVQGTVVAQGNPILGVHMYLHSDDVMEVNCPQGSGDASGDSKTSKALCHAITDADGIFKFTSVPCGIYKLIPFYKGENTIFDVSPPFMVVSIGHDHAIVPQAFQVTGFSVGGRVVNGNGVGVGSVKVIVDGQERSVTDEEGYYKLDQVTSKRYTIEARKKHYKFEKLNDFMVLPNMASIVDIKAVSYDLCGVVQTVDSSYKAKVGLTHGPENAKPQVKQTDENGHFCFEVLPGEYRLSAIAAVPESNPELLFVPPYIDVSVASPLLNVKFFQAQVSVHGAVVCKEKCGSSVSVTLVHLNGKKKEDRRTIALSDKSSEFQVPNVLPGKYRVEVAESGEHKWCWEQGAINVDVGTEDVKGVVFVQKGYWINLVSSHAVDAYLTEPDGSRVVFNIKKGTQSFCVESPGVHELKFVNSCVFFGSSSLRIDTFSPSPIYLKGEKYLLKGQIHIDYDKVIGAEKLPENVMVDILNNEGALVDGTTARLVLDDTNQSTATVYEYSIWNNPGEKLTFVPRDPRNAGEKKILFYPKQQHVSVTEHGCQTAIPPFSARLGMYIGGSVSPPLSDVYIRIIAGGDSYNAPLKQGDVALETMTGSDGLFIAGPLYDDITYRIEASKPGYHVKQVGPHSFNCQKLGQISVHIYSLENGKEPFPSVLLSLSGDDGYRNNSVTGVGGVFVFDDLFPGSFYLRPLLKEYAFTPSAQAIELGSGESKEVIFHANRVAYSAMGVITLLSGQPKEGISVEARAESRGLYEETVTDLSGSYRLRGLLPDTTYAIKVARKAEYGTQIERASPETKTVKVGSDDIKGLDFVVFEQPDITILSGHVEGKRLKELHSYLQVEIKSASDPTKIESIFPLPLSNFFQVKDLPKGKHLLQLRSTQPFGTHKFESEVVEVDLERHDQVHVSPLRYRVEEDLHKQELTPAPVYPLIVGVSVIALFISMPRLKDLYQVVMGFTVSGSTSAAKKDVKKLTVRKKTY